MRVDYSGIIQASVIGDLAYSLIKSKRTMTAGRLLADVKVAALDWRYDDVLTVNIANRLNQLGCLGNENLEQYNERLNSDFHLTILFEQALPIAEKNGVKLTLETDLRPDSFKELLSRLNHPNIKANYDTGNSASLGYDVQDELKTFGSWISNVHIKDRKYHEKTVPLGDGDVNFDLFFSSL